MFVHILDQITQQFYWVYFCFKKYAYVLKQQHQQR